MRVLIIHRDTSIRSALSATLEFEGYLAYGSRDLSRGLRMLLYLPTPSIVLLDAGVPHEATSVFLSSLGMRAQLYSPHRFVLLTTVPEVLSPAVRRTLMTLDIPVIAEPFRLEELLETLAHIARQIDEEYSIVAKRVG
jgi:DNA-binding response OmpR family regulator